jgi:hypothetical protein
MWRRISDHFVTVLLVVLAGSGMARATERQATENRCLSCHATEKTGFGTAHAFAEADCGACHAGDASAATRDDAHRGLIAHPGMLDNAVRACGACHAARVAAVEKGLMHTGHGMVLVTRQILGQSAGGEASASLQALGHGVADSMLRKQCAACHLGQDRPEHRLDVTFSRGGGCLACHYGGTAADGHSTLTAAVPDARCFGCHSRSGRISLSYAGLAETGTTAPAGESGTVLADGRHVSRLAADAHYLAGMSCIDCHTSVGLMGGVAGAQTQRQAVDVTCTDCHANAGSAFTSGQWPTTMAGLLRHVPFPVDADTRFLVTARHGTPLWNIELRDDGAWLHTKLTRRVLRIPPLDPATHSADTRHRRLACTTCHSQWAPNCYGCHMNYDASGEQWDHAAGTATAGRWDHEPGYAGAALPALGVADGGGIEPFVCGMVMTVVHPSLPEELFVRVFAPLSPHTSGAARSCISCHRSGSALGLGSGTLTIGPDRVDFEPAQRLLRDGLPADAWTSLDGSLGGRSPFPQQRPLDREEMDAVLRAPLPD